MESGRSGEVSNKHEVEVEVVKTTGDLKQYHSNREGVRLTKGSVHEYFANSDSASSSSVRAQLAAADPIDESVSHDGIVAAMYARV